MTFPNSMVHGALRRSSDPVAVIMAGGSGTRFWPASRQATPKQFLRFTAGGQSLIQQTVSRLSPFIEQDRVLVVTTASQVELVREQLPHVVVLAEPVPKNTAPCLGLAAAYVQQAVGDVPLVCLPADHLIQPEAALRTALAAASKLAVDQEILVTFGISPTHPETGYGYIKRGERFIEGSSTNSFRVSSFVEKPDLETARNYLTSGEYYWNSGMFVWRPSVLLSAISTFLPELGASLVKIVKMLSASQSFADIYSRVSPISVDHGVLERAQNTILITASDFSWNDVGSWRAWVSELESQQAGTVIIQGDGVAVGCDRTSVLRLGKDSGRFIACVGTTNLVVIETDDAILICDRERTQQVKEVVEILINKGRKELL